VPSLLGSALPAYRQPPPASLQVWMNQHPGWVRALGEMRGCEPGPRDAVVLPVCVQLQDNTTVSRTLGDP
jgi:hypothetical protein